MFCKSSSLIKKYLDNEFDCPVEMRFAAIIGGNPSNGARSPKLWNAAFSHFGIDLKMFPMDVREENLYQLLEQLSNNPMFLGGAIAAPYKIAVANWLGSSLTAEASRIGSVNCLFRNELGDLVGTNTDGEAARAVLIKEVGCIKNKKILILGGGGAGIAVAAYMSSEVGGACQTLLACKNNFPSIEKQEMLRISKIIEWCDISSALSKVDIVINCTSLGSLGLEEESPLTSPQLTMLSDFSIVYDIIYQPIETKLAILAKKRGLMVINGLGMNLEQAVIAFWYVNQKQIPSLNLDAIRSGMLNL